MAATRINNALAIVNCDNVVDSVDDGPAAGVMEIRTGTPPANPEDADTGTLLSTVTYSDPAFGAAADIDPGARAIANPITGDVSADATGTAGYFRVKDSNGVVKFQGDVTLTGGGGDLELNNINIQAGVQVDITSHTVTMPEG